MDDEHVLGDSSTDATPEDGPVKQQPQEAEGSVDEPAAGSGTIVPHEGELDAAGIFWQDTEYLPFTPGDQLPDESGEDPPGEFYPPSAFGIERDDNDHDAGDASVEPAQGDSSGGSDATVDARREIDEIREILLGRETTESRLGLSSLEEQIASVREELREQILAAEGRLREDLESSFAEGLSKIPDPTDLSTALDEILNLVAVSQEKQREAFESHTRETKAALDDLLSLVQELARTLVILIDGGAGVQRLSGQVEAPAEPSRDETVQGMDDMTPGDVSEGQGAEQSSAPVESALDTTHGDHVEDTDATADRDMSDSTEEQVEAPAEPVQTPPAEAEQGETDQTASGNEEVDGDRVAASEDLPKAPDRPAPPVEAPVEAAPPQVGILNLRLASRGRARG